MSSIKRLLSRKEIAYDLSERELEVLDCFSRDLTAKEVGQKLHITEHTVRVHRRNIQRKLNVHTTAGAVGKGLREGVIE